MMKLSNSLALSALAAALLSTACMSNAVKDDNFDYPLRPHDITEDKPPRSPLKGAAKDLQRSNRFSALSKQVVFSHASADLDASSKEALDQMADMMKQNSSAFQKMRIAGFTDNSGDASRNLNLSQRRADSVRKYLISKGIPEDKLESIGMGSVGYGDAMTSENTTDRRVEFEIVQ